MKYTDIKVGDKIKILNTPRMWNSCLGYTNPMHITYPFIGTVLAIGSEDYPYCANIDEYGFALEQLNDFEILNASYEIY